MFSTTHYAEVDRRPFLRRLVPGWCHLHDPSRRVVVSRCFGDVIVGGRSQWRPELNSIRRRTRDVPRSPAPVCWCMCLSGCTRRRASSDTGSVQAVVAVARPYRRADGAKGRVRESTTQRAVVVSGYRDRPWSTPTARWDRRAIAPTHRLRRTLHRRGTAVAGIRTPGSAPRARREASWRGVGRKRVDAITLRVPARSRHVREPSWAATGTRHGGLQVCP